MPETPEIFPGWKAFWGREEYNDCTIRAVLYGCSLINQLEGFLVLKWDLHISEKCLLLSVLKPGHVLSSEPLPVVDYATC